jgi:hypothetical protein
MLDPRVERTGDQAIKLYQLARYNRAPPPSVTTALATALVAGAEDGEEKEG